LTESAKDLGRRAGKENAGYQDIRIQHDFHLWARTFLMAAEISRL
jgi:hypothetical protein